MKKTALLAGILFAMCFAPAAVTAEIVTVSGDMISAEQGENGWYCQMKHGEFFYPMPKFSEEVTPTWRSGRDYPYVDSRVFYPSNSYAAVKKWTANEECIVSISGDINVSENSSDGIIAKIVRNKDILWQETVFSEKVAANVGDIELKKGDSLFFIAESNGNMKGDKTFWNPVITYDRALKKPKVQKFSALNFSELSNGLSLSEGSIKDFSEGKYFSLKGVSLFSGYKTIGIELNAGYTGDVIEIRKDSLNGAAIAEIIICNTDGKEEIQYAEFDSGLSGLHDLYFVSKSGSGIKSVSQIQLLDRNTFGADIGFITLEAEESAIGGGARIHNLSNYDVPDTNGDSRDGNNYNRQQKAVQSASGKSYVDLDSRGEYVEFTVPQNSNRMVLRYTIPRESSGTVNLYLNDRFERALELSSDYNYDTDNYYMRSFDDKIIEIDLFKGDRIKIQKDSENSLEYYGIDLADFEMAEAIDIDYDKYISIEEYGAKPDDDADDTKAIEDALKAAKMLQMDIYIPKGRFIQTKRIEIPAGVNITGAGMYYSEIYCPARSYGKGEWGGMIGYYLKSDTKISNIMISGNSRYRGDSGIAIMGKDYGDGDRCVIDGVWFRNMTTAMGWTNWKNSIIENCRFTGIYADAIHFGDGPQENNKACNNYIRGCGDDGIAVVIRKDYTQDKGMPARGFLAQFNTVQAAYWGRSMSIVGGADVRYTNNIMDGSVNAGLMIAAEELTPSYAVPVENIRIQRNIIRNTSNRLFHHAGIHFYMAYNPVSNARIECNNVSDTASSAIWIDNTGYGDGGTTEFNYNTISKSGWKPAYRNNNSGFIPSLRGNAGF